MPLEDLRPDVVDYPAVVVAPSPKSVTSTLRNSSSQPQHHSFVRKRLRTKPLLLADQFSMTPSPPILSSPSLAHSKKRKSNSADSTPESAAAPVSHDDDSNKSVPTPSSTEQPPKLKKRRNWAPIAVVPMKLIKLPTDLEPDELTDLKLQYLSMCRMEQQIFHVSTLLSVIKCVLRGHADLKKIAALGRRLSKTRKRFLNVQRAVFDVQNERNPAPSPTAPDPSDAASRPPQTSNPSDTDTSTHGLPTGASQSINGNVQVTDAIASQLRTNASVTPDDNSLSHLSFGALDKSPPAPSELLAQSTTPSTSVHPPSPLDLTAQQNGIPPTLAQSQFGLDNASPINTSEIAAAYNQHPPDVSIDQQWLSSAEGLESRQNANKLVPSPAELESQFGPHGPPAEPEMKMDNPYQEQFEQSAPKLPAVNPYEQQPAPNLTLQYPPPNHQFSPVTPVGSHRSVMGTAQDAAFQHGNSLNWGASYPAAVTNPLNTSAVLQSAGQTHFNPMLMQQSQQQQLVSSATLYNPSAPRLPAHLSNQPGALANSISPQVPQNPDQIQNVEMANSFHTAQYGPYSNSSFHGVTPHPQDMYDPQRMLGRYPANDSQPTSHLEHPYGYGNDYIPPADQQRSNMAAPIFDSNRVPTTAQIMSSNFTFAGNGSAAADAGNQYLSHRDMNGGGGIIAEMHAAAASASTAEATVAPQHPTQYHNVTSVEGSVNTIFASDTAATVAPTSSMARPNERESFGSNSNTMSYLGAWGQTS